MNVSEVAADLAAEQRALEEVLVSLTEEQWGRPTPSPRWSVTDQVAHLTYFDRAATSAITEPEGFSDRVAALLAEAGGGADALDSFTLDPVRTLAVGDRLKAWKSGTAELVAASARLADDDRVPWYGPSMGSKSFLTARLMETWAHGHDICDAVGTSRPPTGRLRHIAQLGVITRGWTYQNRRMEKPEGDVRVEISGPDGDTWVWGSETATDRVFGDAVDFCLVVTQRRHVDDTGLAVEGPAARDWMELAQAFAGPPTDGPPAGSGA